MTRQLTADDIIQEMQKAQTSEQFSLLMGSIPSKCYEKCITKPSKSLSSYDQNCVLSCADIYIEAWNVVSNAIQSRAE